MLIGIEQQSLEQLSTGPTRIRDGIVRFSAVPPDAPQPPPGSGPSEAELAELVTVWGYFAIDAANEWWVEWGLLRERSQFRK